MSKESNGSRYTPNFKAKVVLKALAASGTDTEIASAYGVHPVTLSRWKNRFLRQASNVFESASEDSQLKEELSQCRAELELRNEEMEFLQGLIDANFGTQEKVNWVSQVRERLGLNRACELLRLPKSTYYYRVKQRE